MQDHLLIMGWTSDGLHAFILANLIVAGHYTILATRHFRMMRCSKETRLQHIQYGLFIASCGIGHYAMALVMAAMLSGIILWWFSPVEILIMTHLATAAVSVWMEAHRMFGGHT